MSENLIEIYRNYLFALQEIAENGNKYGDKEVIKIYEEKLAKARILKLGGKNEQT